MGKFIYSGFADEISDNIHKQVECLKKLGIEYFEFRSVNGKNTQNLSDEEIKEVMDVLDENNIKVSSIGSPVGTYSLNESLDAQISKLKRNIKIAKMMKTRYIRIFSFYLNDCKLDTPQYEVIRRLKEFVKIAEKEDVILLHENEKGIFGESDVNCKVLFDEIKSDNFKGVFDPANFVQANVDTIKAFELLKDNIVYLHIKDCNKDGNIVPSGDGIGNIKEILEKLYKSGYEGFVSLEPHLGYFVGFDELEQGEEKLNGGVYGGEKAFTLAYNKLAEIIEEITK